MARSPDILYMSEYIKNVLYFATVKPGKILKNTANTHYFSIDNDLVYENYYNDFGPLNLGCVYKYCKILNEKLKQYLNKQSIIHYTSTDPKKKANAAFLLGCYGVLFLNLTPRDALKPLTTFGQTYRHFQDATQGESCYTISLMDCLLGLKKARDLGFFNFHDFNYEEYDRLDRIQGGDLNWIVPGKFLAFIGPVDYSVSLFHPPEMYIDYFKENNVKIVIRLNKRLYDGNVFTKVGIHHSDLFFPDGAYPPRHILFKFLQICEDSNGAIGVHCKAGLGRTGSLIGCYLIKHYRMTAREAIAWMRICRPGSVIGHQQDWLEKLEPWLIKQGNIYRKHLYQDSERMPTHEFGVYSIAKKSLKHRPVVCHKSPSPPPPMHRLSTEIHPQARPQASRVREVPNKTTPKEQYNSRLTSPKLTSPKLYHQSEKPTNKGELNDDNNGSLRRLPGGGEPRSYRPSSRINSPKLKSPTLPKTLYNTNVVNMKNFSGFSAVPPFRNPHTISINTVNDKSNDLLNSSYEHKRFEERGRQLHSTVIVTPHTPFKPVKDMVPSVTSSNYSAVSRGNPANRRRLGRSPSPSVTRPTAEHTRATNTQIPSTKLLGRDNSVTALREALSRLKMSKPREQSIGAASLGARRDAPAPRRAPSVRSDERPLATQGDMLNSIKFQRRLKEVIQSERNKDRFSVAPKEKASINKVNLRGSAGTRQNLRKENSITTNVVFSAGKEKRIPTPYGSFNSIIRPSSPIGKRKNISPK